jgi:probable rRNA maturation factor
MVEILNSNIVSEYIPQWKISDEKLSSALNSVLPQRLNTGTLNVAFVTLSEIKRMNLDYRNIDNPTDVLSFMYEDKNVIGEVYVCPEYISQGFKERDAVVEVLRCIVHGFLHLAGEKHKGHFEQKTDEPMFEKQEQMLDNVINQLKV